MVIVAVLDAGPSSIGQQHRRFLPAGFALGLNWQPQAIDNIDGGHVRN
jgi:hypothetical protein